MFDMAERIDREGDKASANLRVPACDSCRARKVKCDRNVPCTNCVASKISCRTTKRIPEKKQRVLLSSRYDQEIANVNRKLEDLSRALQTLAESNKKSSESTTASSSTHQLTEDALSAPTDGAELKVPYEGDSSFIAHSRRITETLGVAFRASPMGEPIEKVQRLLQEAAAAHTPTVSNPSQQPFAQYPELCRLTLPAMPTVLKLLRLSKATAQRFFIEYPIMNVQDFTEICQDVYFPAEEYSIHTWITVNCGLFYLFRDCDRSLYCRIGLEREDVNTNTRLCRSNVETAIQSLRLCLEPSLDACMALILAASLSLEHAQGSVAWKLTTNAARMCLDLGIHRLPHGQIGPEARRKRIIFWFIYALDKGLAFNFGRTPTIQDYDVTIERPRYSEDLQGVWGLYFLGFLDFFVLEGEIFQQLFSASAQTESQDIKTQRARIFAVKLTELKDSLNMFDVKDIPLKDLRRYSLLSIDIVMHCLLTLVYHVIPPSQPAHPLQFCDECVTAGRTALKFLVNAWRQLTEEDADVWRMFMNWTALFVPFIPYIVVFGNAIAQSDFKDLALLQDVTSIMESAAEYSNAIHKLYCACAKFYQIAEVPCSSQQPHRAQASRMIAQTNPNDGLGSDFQNLSDFPMSQEDWDGMLNEFDLGLGAEGAREMSSYFERHMTPRRWP